MYSFPNLEQVCCSMSISNYCFLTCIQISQEAGKVVWYFHLFKNFLQFVVIHTVKGFGIVNKAEIRCLARGLLILLISKKPAFGFIGFSLLFSCLYFIDFYFYTYYFFPFAFFVFNLSVFFFLLICLLIS